MPTPTGVLTDALTGLWEALRTDHPELPPVDVAVSPATSSPTHGPDRWTLDEDGRLQGLIISLNVLLSGSPAVVEFVIHEAAHVLNWTRGVRDTSARGVYHNGAFLAAATELGMVWPADAERPTGRGLATPELSDEAAAKWATRMEELAPHINDAVPELRDVDKARVRPDRMTLVCQCTPPRRIRAAKTVVDRGPIVCGVCGQEFADQA